MRSAKASALLGVLALAVVLGACGGSSANADRQVAPEQAFLQSMVPHHRSAVEMAKVAEGKAQTRFVEDLAREIDRSQTEEVDAMQKIHARLFDAPLKPEMGAHMALGLSAQEAGMDHMDGARTIAGKRPFDRAFVDEMIPHHQGATRMAEAALARTSDPRLRSLAEGIIAVQEKEIEEMKRFREREYGGRGSERR